MTSKRVPARFPARSSYPPLYTHLPVVDRNGEQSAKMNAYVQDVIMLFGDSLTQGASAPHGFAQRLSCASRTPGCGGTAH